MIESYFQTLSALKIFLKKGGVVRLPLKLLLPDQIPTRSLLDHGPRAIFLTGIHRSGTSWVGHVIAQAEGTNYWREPFNPSCGICKRQQYLYLTRDSEDTYYKHFTDSLFKGRYVGRNPDRVKRPQWFKSNSSEYRSFIKDPTGAFVLDWLNYHYNIDSLILLRHPAAFVSSVCRLAWDFDFNRFLRQEQLMKDWLLPYRDLFVEHNYGGMTVQKASVLWGAVYTVLWGLICRDSYYWKRYEDICNNPMEEFNDIFTKLKLPWSSKIGKAIYSSINGKLTFSQERDSWERSTTEMAKIWKARLSSNEIEIIRNTVATFGLKMYDNDW